jgi:DNA-binding LacI/PurR family transcriptional regulator
LRSRTGAESEFKTRDTLALGATSQEHDVTPVFATADVMAAGIMSGILRADAAWPEDVSIVGFDDLNWCQLTRSAPDHHPSEHAAQRPARRGPDGHPA